MAKKKFDTETILATYLNGMKASIVSLYNLDGTKMSDSARRDLEEIQPGQVFSSFSQKELARWISINRKHQINSYQVLLNIQVSIHSALIKNGDSKIIDEINRLSPTEKSELQFCFDMWEGATKAFHYILQNIDSIDLIIKHNERLRLVNNSLNTPDQDLRPNAYLFDETMREFSSVLRQRKRDLVSTQVQPSGILVSGTLLTYLSSKEWTQIIQQLSLFGYVDQKYALDVPLIDNWLFFALSFEKEETYRSVSQQKLQWEGTPLSLAEFLKKLKTIGALDFSDQNRTPLYKWIDKTVKYRGKRESLVKYLKESNLKSDCFQLAKNETGNIEFEVKHHARKVKGVNPELSR